LARTFDDVSDTDGLAVPEVLLGALAIAFVGSVGKVRHGCTNLVCLVMLLSCEKRK
jgi:hypothetical protein